MLHGGTPCGNGAGQRHCEQNVRHRTFHYIYQFGEGKTIRICRQPSCCVRVVFGNSNCSSKEILLKYWIWSSVRWEWSSCNACFFQVVYCYCCCADSRPSRIPLKNDGLSWNIWERKTPRSERRKKNIALVDRVAMFEEVHHAVCQLYLITGDTNWATSKLCGNKQ